MRVRQHQKICRGTCWCAGRVKRHHWHIYCFRGFQYCGSSSWTLLGADKSVCKKESILYCVGKAAPLAIATILAGYGAGKLVSAFKANVGVVEALTEAGIGSTAEGILADSVFQKIGKTIQYAKSGGLESATADFERLTQGIEVTIREEGVRTATLSNGSKITVRPTSSGGFPTLDINTPGNPVIKVRY